MGSCSVLKPAGFSLRNELESLRTGCPVPEQQDLDWHANFDVEWHQGQH